MNAKTPGILKESIAAIWDDTKLIRLATITTFIHSLLFILYLIYLLITLGTAMWWDTTIWWLINDYVDLVAPSAEIWVILIIIGIALLIWYSILPPIWEASMIYYIDSKHKSGSLSLGKGTGRFFPMFEFNATISILSIIAWVITASRFYAMDILNILTISLLIMRWIIVVLAMILLPYTKFIITLENKNYYAAMKSSMGLALRNLWTTLKYVGINIFLYLRFFLNIIIVIGIPLGMLRFASRFDFADNTIFQVIVIIVLISLIAFTAYINGIIEAFFISYWWRVYKKIRKVEDVKG